MRDCLNMSVPVNDAPQQNNSGVKRTSSRRKILFTFYFQLPSDIQNDLNVETREVFSDYLQTKCYLS